MNKPLLILLLFIFTLNIKASNRVKFRQIASETSDIRNFCLTPGGFFLYAANNNNVEVYDLKTGEMLDKFSYQDSTIIRSIVLSCDSLYLITGFSDGVVVIHDLTTNVSNSYNCSEYMITTIDINSKLIVLGTYNGEVIFMDLSGQITDRKKIHDDVVTKVTISRDGRLLATAGMDGKLNICDLSHDRKVYCLTHKEKPCRDVEIDKDVDKLLACYDNGKIETWRIRYDNRIELFEKKHFKGWIMDVCFLEDGKLWAACSSKGNILVRSSIGHDYTIKLRNPLYQVNFVPIYGVKISIIVSEKKKGLKIIRAEDMKMKE